jgi:O-antigen ligase
MLLKEIFYSKSKTTFLNFFRLVAIGLLIFSVISFAARLALFLFLLGSIILVFKTASSFWNKIIFAGCIVSIFSLVFVIPSSKKRIDEICNTKLTLPNSAQKSEEVNFRYGIYHCVGGILKEHWLFGVGLGNVQKGLDNCYSGYTYKNYDDYSNVTYNSHNQYLDLWLKLGIFGLALFLVFLLWGINNMGLSYGIFLFIIMMSMLTENIFDRQVGVVFFTLFNTLFFINRKNYFEKSTN